MRPWSVLGCAAVVTMAGAAHAQEPQTPTELDTIVVVGTREGGYRATVAPQVVHTETPLHELPISVQVVTREIVRDRGVRSAGEALRYVPGLSPQVGWGGVNDQVSLRGFPVAHNLRNGLRRNYFIQVERLTNVEQIEVLKGSASALYGRFEPGGVVNYVTKRPLDTNFAEITASLGSYESYDGTFDGNVVLAPGVAARLNASASSRESFREFVFQDDWFLAPVISFDAGTDTRITLEGEYGERSGYFDRGFGNDPFFLQVPRERQFGEPDARLDNRGGLVALFVEHESSDDLGARLALGAGRSEQDDLYYGFAYPPVVGAGGPDPRVARRPVLSFDQEDNRTAQLELYGRFQTGPVGHRLLAGVEIDHEQISYRTDAGPVSELSVFDPVYGVSPSGPFTTAYDETITVGALGVYLQDEMAVGDFRILAGVRVDDMDGESISRLLADSVATRSEMEVSPRLGVTWLASPELSLYASYSRAFRPQLELGRLSNGEPPEALEADGFEIGAKFDLLNSRLRFTAAAFEIERRNAAVPELPDYLFVTNIGESRSRGVEFDLSYEVTPRWRAIASYTYLDTEVTADTDIPVGNRFFNAPEHSLSLWTTYDFGGSFEERLSVGAGIQHIGERAGDVYNTVFIPAYTRVDGALTYLIGADRRVRAQLNVQNLLDEDYYDSGGGYLPLYPGSPRVFSLALSYAFGEVAR